MQPALYINTQTDLAPAVQRLSRSDFLALDTEFMRESTYYPRLCLIQAATADCCVLIDPLTIADLGVLWDFLLDRSRVKVLHAARQDIETLSQAIASARPTLKQAIPGPLFDTQIAAGLLGHAGQIGYAGLVAARLNHPLTKGQARTDWTRRPLHPEQLAYAADDVRYLVPLYHDLRNALATAERLVWAAEENAALEDPRLYRTEPEDAWRRLKAPKYFLPAQRATAKLLAAWRESRAMQSDKPRGWILTDEALRELAERRPRSLEDLQNIRSLPAATSRRHGAELVQLIDEGRLAAGDAGEAVVPPRPQPQQIARVTRLMAFVRAEAQRLHLAPELLATRRDAEQLVYSGNAEHLRQGWRGAVIGERLIALAQEIKDA